ncbi:MAG: hypothetical protein NT121_21135 [Chloroflexi bacterium]|nr:hypothetical protein [Chloroflexota bacterium]
MKNHFYIAITASCLCQLAYAQDGHNGIKFEMTQKQVEALGFVCNPPKKPSSDKLAECHHMDMTGVAFGYPMQDYEVSIGASNNVDSIKAKLNGVRSLADVLELHEKVKNFFPIEDVQGTHRHQGMYSRDAWRAKNNAGLSLFQDSGAPPIIKPSLSVTFYSPRFMFELDKLLAQREKKQ